MDAAKKTPALHKVDAKKLATLAMITAIAYVVMLLSKLMPSVYGFLDFDFKDVVICIGGFIYGPVSAAAHRGSRHTRSKARMLPQNKRRFMRIDLRFFPSYHTPLLPGKKKSLDRGPATCYTPTKETEEREK